MNNHQNPPRCECHDCTQARHSDWGRQGQWTCVGTPPFNPPPFTNCIHGVADIRGCDTCMETLKTLLGDLETKMKSEFEGIKLDEK